MSVAALYMLNIVGSITMTIQPIYALFEKNEKVKEEPPQPENDQDSQGRGSYFEISQTDDTSAHSVTAEPVYENEPDNCSNMVFYIRRLSIPFCIVALSTIFPDVNLILSLLGGSICGVCFIIMPVFFYR